MSFPTAKASGSDDFFHSEDYRNTLTVAALYKTIANTNQKLPLQFSIVWGMQDIFNVKGLRFNGFADFWWQENYSLKSQFTFITEPQIWYNVG